MKQPSEFYIVTSFYEGLGFGGAGDPTESEGEAYDCFAERRSENGPAWVTFVSLSEAISRDVTHLFDRTLKDICKIRGLDYPGNMVPPRD